jgi:hypothetical protein
MTGAAASHLKTARDFRKGAKGSPTRRKDDHDQAYHSYDVDFFAALLLPACAGYKQQVVPFKLPSAYPNMTEVADAQIAAQAYEDAKNAEVVFGFDIRGAEILPVKVVFNNRGRNSLEIAASRPFPVDVENQIRAPDTGVIDPLTLRF